MTPYVETVLAAVRKAEYQSQISIQKLIYLNSLARSLVLRCIRQQPKEEEALHLVDKVGLLNRFAMNGENLARLQGLPEEEKRAGFLVIQKGLVDLLSFFNQELISPSPDKVFLLSRSSPTT